MTSLEGGGGSDVIRGGGSDVIKGSNVIRGGGSDVIKGSNVIRGGGNDDIKRSVSAVIRGREWWGEKVVLTSYTAVSNTSYPNN